ncbi:uncharacterized protein B0H64DRAFT_203634 [Chaetomium fimeti]|uniref:2EXR domain-containing protein n=1 Tax=Chaetomium fimeti TaxID=1854472 RepID=A0AAE0LPS7_9PEZI|nr:hypothetical protein B0H64DRAFT_203634 [Chaetomium fimeti]
MSQNISGQAPQGVGWYSLPPELRFMIYRSTWEARKITVHSVSPSVFFRVDENLKHVVHGTPTLPVTAHLNDEARQETLRHYHPIVGDLDCPSYKDWNLGPCMYFNPSLDVVFFSWIPVLWNIPQPPPASIRRLLDILLVAEHIVPERMDDFLMLQTACLKLDTPVLENICPALSSVDHVDAYGGANGRYRLCRDPRCTEPICDTLTKGPWRQHTLYFLSFVEMATRERGMLPYQPCREVEAYVSARIKPRHSWNVWGPGGTYRG